MWRPLSRRDRSTARPARVDIRCRKPCFLARRRLLGWYVRFTMFLLDHEASWPPADDASPSGSGAARCSASTSRRPACAAARNRSPSRRPGRVEAGRPAGQPGARPDGATARPTRPRAAPTADRPCAQPRSRCYGPSPHRQPGWSSSPGTAPCAWDVARHPASPTTVFSTGVDVVVDSWTGGEAFEQVDDAEVLWTACADVLREQVSEAVWLTSFNGARPVRIDGDTLVLGVPSSVVRERIEGRYLALVKSALADVGGADLDAADRGAHRRRRRRARPSNGSPTTIHGSDPPACGRTWRTPLTSGDLDQRRRSPARLAPGEPPLHLRGLRHRHVQPLRPRRRPLGGRDAGPVLQPAVHLRRRRAGQDPPPAGHRPLRQRELPGVHGALRLDRDLPEPVRRRHPHQLAGRLQEALPRGRRAAARRHPVHRGPRGPPGGALPHLQRPPPGQPPDRAVLRSAARRHPDPRGPAAQPVQDGPDHRDQPARARDPPRHPPQEGRDRDRHPAGRRASSSSPPTSPTTSASSRAP